MDDLADLEGHRLHVPMMAPGSVLQMLGQIAYGPVRDKNLQHRHRCRCSFDLVLSAATANGFEEGFLLLERLHDAPLWDAKVRQQCQRVIVLAGLETFSLAMTYLRQR